MRTLTIGFALFVFLTSAAPSLAQADDICGEFGLMPSLDAPRLSSPFIYGKVILRGLEPGAKQPRVSVTYLNRAQSPNRITVTKTGNYCFRKILDSGGTLVVEIDGVEVSRRALPTVGPPQQREDFEVNPPGTEKSAPPSTVSARFYHPPNEKTTDLYRRAFEAEAAKDLKKAAELMSQIVTIDPVDFIGWAQLGAIQFGRNMLPEAEVAFRKSISLREDYTGAWINVGKMRVFQKQLAAGIEIFKHVIDLDPNSARAYQLLGEAYLQNKQGTLGVEALDQALKLDPVGMAECHLLKARLFDLAGAKNLAAAEYKAFLSKVSEHPDKKKFEKYVKDHLEQ